MRSKVYPNWGGIGAAALGVRFYVTQPMAQVRRTDCLIISIPLRIRILRPVVGIVDGVSLSHLIPGIAYEVSDSHGLWLVSQGNAEEMRASTPAMVIPLDNPLAFEQLTRGIQVIPPQAEAADTHRRRPRKRSRK